MAQWKKTNLSQWNPSSISSQPNLQKHSLYSRWVSGHWPAPGHACLRVGMGGQHLRCSGTQTLSGVQRKTNLQIRCHCPILYIYEVSLRKVTPIDTPLVYATSTRTARAHYCCLRGAAALKHAACHFILTPSPQK